MSATCPACNTPLSSESINVAADTALCRTCNHFTTYSSIIHAPLADLISCPPEGCIVHSNHNAWIIRSTTITWRALFYVPFALFWNLIVGGMAIGILASNPPPAVLILSLHLGAGAYIAWIALCSLFGDNQVRFEGDHVYISGGISKLRWELKRRRDEIDGVREHITHNRNGTTTYLMLTGARPVKFGSLLNDAKRHYVHAVIAAKLAQTGTRQT